MAVRWPVVVAIPSVFLIGAVATINPSLAIAATAILLLAVMVRTRLRPRLAVDLQTGGVRPDWVVLLIPITLAIQTLYFKATLLILGILIVVAFLRKPDSFFRIQAGPVVLLLLSSAIVFSRPATIYPLLIFLLVGTLTLRLITTVDARRIITSLIDGCGLYLVGNVLGHLVGLQSPAADLRIGGLVESTGFVRTIYPLTSTLNSPPTIAAVYIVAFGFLILEPSWLRRSLRLICLTAAIIVLIGAGTRVPMVVALVLSVAVICFPAITRWIAQVATILAATSAVILPMIIASTQFVIAPLVSLAPGRDVRAGSIVSLNNRDFIWERSIPYWFERVNYLPDVLFGYGVNGQYRSGASLIYRDRIASIVRNPELATMHNSFLQQLFDGGLVGWVLLVVAVYWASARLAKRRRDWGNAGPIGIIALTCLLLSGMTEVSIAPGPTQDTFWLFIIFIGVACQASGIRPDRNSPQHVDQQATAAQNTPSLGTLGSPH